MATKKLDRELITTSISLIFRHRFLTLMFLVSAITGTLTVHFLLPTYKATSVVHLRSPETSPILNATAKMTGYTSRDFNQNVLNQSYLKILSSQNLAAFVTSQLTKNFDAFGPLSRELLAAHGLELEPGQAPSPDQVKDFADSIVGRTYFRGKDDDLIEMSSITTSPRTAVQTTNLMNSIVIRYLFEYESKEVSDIEDFLNEQIAETQARINDLSDQVEQTRSKITKSDIYSGLPPQNSLTRLTEEFELARIRLEENQSVTDKIIREIRARFNKSPASVQVEEEQGTTDTVGLRGRIVDKYRLLLEEREGLKSKYKAIRDRLQVLSKQYRPEFEQKAAELNKKLDTEHYLYQELKRQLSDMNVYRISIANRVRPYALAMPEAARRETSLDRKLMIGSFAALAALIVILFLLEQANPVLLSKDDMTSIGIVPLGSIPEIGVKPSLVLRIDSWMAGTQAGLRNKHKERLAFQFLRNRMMNILKRRQGVGQVVSILSSDPNDGKSFVTANLAQLMGRMKIRTLVVDFDVVKSAMSDFFKSEGTEGLLDIVEGRRALKDVVRESEIPNVHFLPSGKSETRLESMASADLKTLLNSFRENYDLVILDTPAYMARPESVMIANESDHIVVVANFGKTKLLALRELMESLNPERLTHLYGIINRHEDYLRSAYHPYYVHAYSVVKGEDPSVAS